MAMSLTNPAGEPSANEQPPTHVSTDDIQEPKLVENAGPGPPENPPFIPTIGTPDYLVWYFFCCNLSEPAILKPC
ncbi:hypothetical protein ANO14919_139800 [Xylariales sp. No.14919]|nr:hypothetical protein ANO14919_139800 [Xylariales sp. No.14919]